MQQNTLGNIAYEITNYLGNVNVVISDRKIWNATPNNAFKACTLSRTDYFPFGMEISSRTTNSDNYRFGYNGMESDNETKGSGNSYTTEFRQYDPRIGRWLSLDPLMAQYPMMSPYVAFNNNPIFFVDPLGLEGEPPGEPEIGFVCKDEKEAIRVYKGDGEWATPKEFESFINDRINENENQISSSKNQLESINNEVTHLKTELSGAYKKMVQLEKQKICLENEIYEMQCAFSSIEYNSSSNNGTSLTSSDPFDLSFAKTMDAMRAQREWEARCSGSISMCYPEQYFIGPGSGNALLSGTKGVLNWSSAIITRKVAFHTTQKFVIRSGGETTFGWGLRNTSTNAMIRFERHSFMVKGMPQGTKTYMTHINIGNGGSASHYFLNPYKIYVYGKGLPY